MHPVDRATWWMEYLLRHPQPEDMMRNPAIELSWWQYLLFDIFILFALTMLVVILFVVFLVKFCCCHNRIRIKSKKE